MAGYNPLAFGLTLIGIFGLLAAAYGYLLLKKGKRTPEDDGAFGAAFCIGGVLGLIAYIQEYFLQTSPPQYIEVYGAGYGIFTIAMFAAGITLLKGWEGTPSRYLAGILGIVLLWLGYMVFKHQMGKNPLPTVIMYAMASLGALLLPFVGAPTTRKWVVLAATLLFLGFGALALYTGLKATDGHIVSALAAAAKAAAEKAAAAAAST